MQSVLLFAVSLTTLQLCAVSFIFYLGFVGFLERMTDRERQRETERDQTRPDRRTERQRPTETDRDSQRQSETETDRQADRQTERYRLLGYPPKHR